jgi:hypothetical protein
MRRMSASKSNYTVGAVYLEPNARLYFLVATAGDSLLTKSNAGDGRIE